MTDSTKKCGGRASRYNPEWCEQLLDLGEQGMSFAQMARELRITRSMLYNYRDNHPEFAEALKAARDLSVAVWTSRLVNAANDRNSNAQLLMFLVSNLFPDDFKMKRDLAISGPDGEPIPLRSARVLTTAELKRLAAPMVLDIETEIAEQNAQHRLNPNVATGGADGTAG